MTEWSKVVALGAILFGGKGSNPFVFNFFFNSGRTPESVSNQREIKKSEIRKSEIGNPKSGEIGGKSKNVAWASGRDGHGLFFNGCHIFHFFLVVSYDRPNRISLTSAFFLV